MTAVIPRCSEDEARAIFFGLENETETNFTISDDKKNECLNARADIKNFEFAVHYAKDTGKFTARAFTEDKKPLWELRSYDHKLTMDRCAQILTEFKERFHEPDREPVKEMESEEEDELGL
jgi:hypothetical protein